MITPTKTTQVYNKKTRMDFATVIHFVATGALGVSSYFGAKSNQEKRELETKNRKLNTNLAIQKMTIIDTKTMKELNELKLSQKAQTENSTMTMKELNELKELQKAQTENTTMTMKELNELKELQKAQTENTDDGEEYLSKKINALQQDIARLQQEVVARSGNTEAKNSQIKNLESEKQKLEEMKNKINAKQNYLPEYIYWGLVVFSCLVLFYMIYQKIPSIRRYYLLRTLMAERHYLDGLDAGNSTVEMQNLMHPHSS